MPALPPRTGCAFQEMARRHGDYALAGVAALVKELHPGWGPDAIKAAVRDFINSRTILKLMTKKPMGAKLGCRR